MTYTNSEGKIGSKERRGNESPQEACTKWLCCAFCEAPASPPSNALLPCGQKVLWEGGYSMWAIGRDSCRDQASPLPAENSLH